MSRIVLRTIVLRGTHRLLLFFCSVCECSNRRRRSHRKKCLEQYCCCCYGISVWRWPSWLRCSIEEPPTGRIDRRVLCSWRIVSKSVRMCVCICATVFLFGRFVFFWSLPSLLSLLDDALWPPLSSLFRHHVFCPTKTTVQVSFSYFPSRIDDSLSTSSLLPPLSRPVQLFLITSSQKQRQLVCVSLSLSLILIKFVCLVFILYKD